MKKSTYSRVRPIVSTVRKSHAIVPTACPRRNSVQLGPSRRGAGPSRRVRKMERTEVAETVTPSLRHSPTIRTYPQRGFSLASRTTSSTTSSGRQRRSRRPARGYVQRRRTSSRCQRSSVDGVTRKIPQRSRGRTVARVARTSRSAAEWRGRATWRRSTINWWRNTAISTSFASGAGPNPTRPSIRRTTKNPNVRAATGDHPASPASCLITAASLKLHPTGSLNP